MHTCVMVSEGRPLSTPEGLSAQLGRPQKSLQAEMLCGSTKTLQKTCCGFWGENCSGSTLLGEHVFTVSDKKWQNNTWGMARQDNEKCSKQDRRQLRTEVTNWWGWW